MQSNSNNQLLNGSDAPKTQLVPNDLGYSFLFDESDASLLLVTNARIYEFHEEIKVADKVVRAKFYLVTNPESKNEPYLYTAWHAASEKTATREKELKAIHVKGRELRDRIEREFGIKVKTHKIAADTNENTLGINASDEFELQINEMKMLTKTPAPTVFGRPSTVLDGLSDETSDAKSDSEPDEMKERPVLIKSVFKSAAISKGVMKKQRGAFDDEQDEKKEAGTEVKSTADNGEEKNSETQELKSLEKKSSQPMRGEFFYKHSYNLCTNAQMEKHKKKIPFDSKPTVMNFEFEEYEATKEETLEISALIAEVKAEVKAEAEAKKTATEVAQDPSALLISALEKKAEKEVARTLQTLADEVKLGFQRAQSVDEKHPQKELKQYDFATQNTKYEDHLPSQVMQGPEETDGIRLKVRGLQPTAGLKQVRSAAGLYTEQFYLDHKERQKRHVDFTYKFLEIIYQELGLKGIPDTTTDKKTLAVLEKMTKGIPGGQNIDQYALLNILITCANKAQQSKEYENLEDMMTEGQKKKVRAGIGGLTSCPWDVLLKKAVAEYKKSGKDPFQKLIQVFSQELGLQCDAGYDVMNGKCLQGPDPVDDANIESMLKDVMKKHKDTNKKACSLILATEAGEKDKSPHFEVGMRKGLYKPYLEEWNRVLDEYLIERKANKLYYLKDRLPLFSKDLQMREKHVADLKKQLADYAKVETTGGEIALRAGILKKVQGLKKGLHGVKFKRCLDHIEYQFLAHEAADKKLEQKDTELEASFFCKSLESLYQAERNCHSINGTTERQTFASCYDAVDVLYKYANTLEGDRAEACRRVACEAISSLNAFLKKWSSINKENEVDKDQLLNKELEDFKQEFVAILHSQDKTMNDRRSSIGATLDVVTGIVTLGMLHGTKAAITKAATSVTSAGIFHRPTTRVSLIDNIENNFNKCVAAITPRPALSSRLS